MTHPTLEYFQPTEFQGWYLRVHPDLLLNLDAIRDSWKSPIEISPAPGAVGRNGGADTSGHNIDKWGSVLALDIFVRGLSVPQDITRFVAICKKHNILGVGFYPDWSHPSGLYTCGFHIDIKPGKWRTWSGIKDPEKDEQIYTSFIYGYDLWRKRHESV